ncbi:AraC-like DNA-binding protein [Pseudonocardia hierapolitana]|uniref:AraC-like DNA-binding protein n=1 Tax=Pseudonocardia hierapolitana TaxID=1128676 RepID=A0A561SP27_9PSEU|nr:helix-turn-helix domain-containing protein [Pseudonocardia hierapolitana]TWF76622.1 AraC-like DNA-binding protein [Pseudonocardia hierapolitana]
MGSATGRAERLPVWRDLIREHFVALDIDADPAVHFVGAVRSTPLGHLRVASVDSTPQGCLRTPGLARDGDTYLQVGMVTRGEAVLCQDGREAVLRPGDFAIYETDRPFFWGFRHDWQLYVYTWPRATVSLDQAASRQLTARTLGGGSGLGAIVGRMLHDLVAAPPVLSRAGGTRLADEVAELVTTVATERLHPDPPDAPTTDLMRKIDAYIAAHIADPGLGPDTIARAHFVSTRHLHRLYSQQGTTVTQRVRAHRLERCRRELLDPRSTTSITGISRRWGFTDLPTFSRAFRSAYGSTPSAYRRRNRE